MIASLPMYDWPEIRQQTNQWWQVIRQAMVKEGIASVPDLLTRSDSDSATWRSPELLLGQTCGFPYTHGFSDSLRLLATPDYSVYGCKDYQYQSLILCREDNLAESLVEFKDSKAGVNDWMSQSGFSAFRHSIAPIADGKPFFDQVVVTGGHRYSMAALQKGKIDICAVDPICFAIANKYVPSLTVGLRVLTATEFAPCLPLVMSRQLDDSTIRRVIQALLSVHEDPVNDEIREALFIKGLRLASDQDYQTILNMENSAIDLGYASVQ